MTLVILTTIFRTKIEGGHFLRVLIICPRLYLGGGVTNYYNSIRSWFSIEAHFLEVGALKGRETPLEKIRHLFRDIMRFHNLLKINDRTFDLIHLTPSFDYKSLIRDGLLLRIARKFRYKVLVMFQGWNEKHARIVEKYLFHVFFLTYNKANAFTVQASEFKGQMRNWGFNQPIYVETTAVDDTLLDGFSIENRRRRVGSGNTVQLLFLARIEKDKGICETIKAAQILSSKYQNLYLAIAGDGTFTDKAHQLVSEIGIRDRVSFLGYVTGEKKKKAFINSDIYVFPTYHGEGTPTSVLEAMAFGLPVITRPVGGLKDVFVDGEHGFMTESKDPRVIASLIEKIILDKDLWKKMSVDAHEYAKERFMASQVAKRLEDIYIRTVN